VYYTRILSLLHFVNTKPGIVRCQIQEELTVCRFGPARKFLGGNSRRSDGAPSATILSNAKYHVNVELVLVYRAGRLASEASVACLNLASHSLNASISSLHFA
jgi:hypothetical protein